MKTSLGHTLLAVYLILQGLVMLLSLSVAGLYIVLGLLAVAAGVCILLGR